MERIPPNDKNAEISVLGAAMIDPEAIYAIAPLLKPEDFYFPEHKEIFEAMLELEKRSQPIDLITLSDTLRKRQSLEAAGGSAYLTEITDSVPTAANAKEYAKVVSEKALYRRMISLSSEIAEDSFRQQIDAKTLLDNAEEKVFGLAKEKQTGDFIKVDKVLEYNLKDIADAQTRGKPKQGILSGFTDLDRLTRGFQKGNLVIIAARPSVGKTAFALNIAQNVAAEQGKNVAMFSLEMSAEELGLRLISMIARVDSYQLLSGKLNNDDLQSIASAVETISHENLFIDDVSTSGVMEIRNKCRRMSRQAPLDMILIDYIQRIDIPGYKDGKQNMVAYISNAFKSLAREMNCPVLVLAQLNRASQGRNVKDHRPMLSDIRDSGAIEQDADMVIFLHREDYYKPAEERDNVVEVILAKNRNGAIGDVKLTWLPKFTKFANILYKVPDQAADIELAEDPALKPKTTSPSKPKKTDKEEPDPPEFEELEPFA